MDIVLMLTIALAIDLAAGEPPRAIHPVVWMGKVASFLERRMSWSSPAAQFAYGCAVTVTVMGLFVAPVYLLLLYLKGLSFAAYVLAGALLLKPAFSLKQMRRAAFMVKELVQEGNLDKARRELRWLVSRDTGDLPQPLVVSAAVESVAENACDSFVAPLFYFLLLGVPGAVAYRVVNTLDAMVGYHGRYEYLGKFAARLDDVVNFIPARLTALLLVLASFLAGKDGRASWRVAVREHSRTESPNAGWTMAAMAGALGVQLEKAGHYRLGETDAPLTAETIAGAVRLMVIAALSWWLICFTVGAVRFVAAS